MGKVAIIGSRNWTDIEAVRKVVQELELGTVVISGGARGVDRIAEKEANVMGFVVVIAKPPWVVHGKKAGPMRNAVIVDIADRGIAFWDGVSPGTKGTIEMFEESGKTVEVIRK